MKVEWTRKAIQGAAGVFHFLNDLNPAAAEATYTAIFQSAAKLGQFPSLGAPLAKEPYRALVLPRYGYVIVYRIEADHVEITSVYHGRTDWLREFE